jgi:adhesin transport system outer membrane protein
MIRPAPIADKPARPVPGMKQGFSPVRQQVAATASRLLLVAGIVLGPSAASFAQTLPEVIRKTISTNPDVQIEVERRLAADQAKTRARAGWFPNIELRSGIGKEERLNPDVEATYGGRTRGDRRDVSLNLSQMLFDGMGTASEVRRNEFRVQSAADRVAATSEQIALRAIESYLEILRQQEILVLTQENLLYHERTLDQIQQRVTGGFSRPADLDQIRARVALAKANLTTAEANQEVALINYKLVVGELPGRLERPKAPDIKWLPANAEEAVRIALDSNRLMHSARADVDAAGAQLSATRAALAPRIELEVGGTRTQYRTSADNPKEETNYAMIRLRYNLFAGGGDMARINEARHQENESREVLSRAERQLEQNVQLSWNAYRSARDRIPNLRQHSESSRLTRDAYAKQFILGQRSLLDMLDSENEHFTAKANYLNGQFVELFARYRLLADTGYLLVVFDIDPRQESLTGEEPLSGRSAKITGFPRATKPADETAEPVTAAPAVTPPAVMKPLPTDKPNDELKPALPPTSDRKPDATPPGIQSVIDDWIDAWSKQDVSRYLSTYATEFQLPQGKSREDWARERRSRIEKPASIKVSYADLQTAINGETATIRFRQTYVSDSISSTDTKELDMVRRDGRWLIVSERVIR